MRLLVALSGGVDSSAAALLLAREGHDLVGLTMKNWCYGESDAEGRSCCSLESIEAARRVADALGFPHYVVDFEAPFTTHVIRPFVRDYLAGLTPNPCVECNRRVRFPGLWNRARAWGCEGFATGHYARIVRDGNGRPRVARPRERARDQSYVLWGVPSDVLEHVRFPLGDLAKSEVRRLVGEAGLPTATRPDSQEICFVPDGDYGAVLTERAPGFEADTRALEEGEIVNAAGRTLGRHSGAARFTIGQRRGLGIASPRPLYVLAVDALNNRVVVGEEDELLVREACLDGVNWPAGRDETNAIDATVQIRSRHEAAPARIERLPAGKARVTFATAQRAITPGQSAVFYDGDVVLGGGVVEASRP